MIRIQRNDFKKLYQSREHEGLHERISAIAKSEPGDVLAFDETSLPQAFARILESWLRTGIEFTQTHELDDALAKQQRAQREEAAANEKAIVEAAQKRVVHYIREEGLLADADDPDNFNLNLITGWFSTNKARFTAHHVDLAIAQLAPRLRWACWSPRLQAVAPPVEEAAPKTDYLDKFTRAELIAKLRTMGREERERFIERGGGLAKINARLAAPERVESETV